jgi:predicted Zn-dependent protease
VGGAPQKTDRRCVVTLIVMKIKRLIALVMLFVISSSGLLSVGSPASAVTIPVLISPEQEAAIGLQVWEEVLKAETRSTDDRKRKRVARVVAKMNAKLAQSRTWTIEVFESEQVNAFAISGGYIGVYTGMLDLVQSDDELAVVLGHEISHVAERHFAKQYSAEIAAILGVRWLRAKSGGRLSGKKLDALVALLGVAGKGVALAFSRSFELEADRVGLMLMASSKFDPRSAIPFWTRMDSIGDNPPELLSTHPSDAKRIEQFKQLMPEAIRLFEAS